MFLWRVQGFSYLKGWHRSIHRRQQHGGGGGCGGHLQVVQAWCRCGCARTGRGGGRLLDEGIADLRDVAGIEEVSLTVEQPGSWMVEVPDARRDVPGAQVGGARG